MIFKIFFPGYFRYVYKIEITQQSLNPMWMLKSVINLVLKIRKLFSQKILKAAGKKFFFHLIGQPSPDGAYFISEVWIALTSKATQSHKESDITTSITIRQQK